MIAVGYKRVSTEGQEESGLSLEAQEATVRAWAASRNVIVTGLEADTASGADTERAGLARAVDLACQHGAGAVLVVASLDRLSRSVRHVHAIMDRLHAAGAALVAVREAIDTSTPTGRLIAGMMGTIAEWERDTVRSRTVQALDAKRARGEHVGPVPYGYARRAGILVRVASEQRVISMVKRWSNEGFSLREIQEQLTRRAIKTRAGQPFARSTIAAIIKSEELD